MNENNVALQTRDLMKHYHQGDALVKALDGVDLTIHKGEFTSIMGRSGSGTSTLLNMLGAHDRPSDGSVKIAGIDVAKLPSRTLVGIRRSQLRFVFHAHDLA